MGQPRVVEAANSSGFVRVEHVKAREITRIVVGDQSRRETMLEIGVGEFLDRLGLRNWPLPQPVGFLIFAGNEGSTVGGAGDFVGSFQTEAVAREAFGALCKEFAPDWAQLVRMEKGGRLSMVCWRGAMGGHRPEADLADRAAVGLLS